MRHHQKWQLEKTRKFQRLLLDWYEKNRRELPWRNRPTPYRVWVAEVMLQQTQVRTVLPYFERFMMRFPDVNALAEAGEEDVLKYWAGLGYYARARNLNRAARKIVRDYGGHFPDSPEETRLLPGVGRYTAGAIHSIAFNRPEPIVDGNVRRVISRIHGIVRGAPENFFWEQAAAWVPSNRPSDFNQAIMELGALLCVPAQPACPRCPVQSLCEARNRGIQDRIPAPRASRAADDVELVILVLEGKAGLLMTTERAAPYIPGKWGLPMRTVKSGDSPEAVAANLAGRISGKPLGLRKCTPVRHGITHRRIRAHVFHADLDRVAFRLSHSRRYRWIDRPDLEDFITSALFRKALHSAHRFP